MKSIGIINRYNGKYGTIKVDNTLIDFEKKDISFNQDLKVNDIVEFRIEDRFPNIKLARNITLIEKKKISSEK